MNKNIKEFIDRLSEADIKILLEILEINNDIEVKDYIVSIYNDKEKKSRRIVTSEELTKEIPITYLPIIGVGSLKWYFSTIYDYMIKTDYERLTAKNFGPTSLKEVNICLDFFITHLNNLIKIHNGTISTGVELLERNYNEKRKIILENKKEIYEILASTDAPYIFSTCKNFEIIKEGLSKKGEIFNKESEVLPILIRYSNLEDLEKGNIESFKKFIRK